MVGYFENHYGDVMSTKTKTRPEAQQQKLGLRSVKKKNLFKKKDTTSKSTVAKSPGKSQVKDEAAIKQAEKKSEFLLCATVLSWYSFSLLACSINKRRFRVVEAVRSQPRLWTVHW